MASFLRLGCLLAIVLGTSSAAAQSYDGAPPPAEPLTLVHTYLEGRLGVIGQSAGQMHYGGAVEGSAGIGFRWLDLGLTARYGTLPGADARLSYLGFGPEIAVRKSLGDGATLRLGIAPMYALAWDAAGASRRVGADALAQLLFTIDNQHRPAWRAGFGLRAGRYQPTSGGDASWSIGLDLLARSWW